MRILITGGTSGIGYGVTRQIADHGWKVTIVGRNIARGTQIASQTGATFIQADLSIISEVQKLSKLIDEPLDALVMCAGNVSIRPELNLTREGLETTFATNFLSKFALSQMLLPKIKPNGCIVMVGGNGKHKNTSMEWDVPHTGIKAAFKAALAVDLYASQLANRTPHLRVHTCYPGMVRTNLLRDAALPIRLLAWLFSKPIKHGSSHITRLILEKHSEVHWKLDKPLYFSPDLPAGQAVEHLWEYSQQVLSPYLH